jgi:hypothetical protein
MIQALGIIALVVGIAAFIFIPPYTFRELSSYRHELLLWAGGWALVVAVSGAASWALS